MKMVVLGIFAIAVMPALIISSGDFIVVTSPSYVRYVDGASAIETSEIGPMIAASFGLPLEEDLKWNGLEEVNLFKRPKATVVISVNGVPEGTLGVQGVAHFKTVEVESSLNTESLIKTIEEIQWKENPLIVDFSLDGNLFDISSHHSEVFAGLPSSMVALRDEVTSGIAENWFTPSELASLNVSVDEDFKLVSELYMIQQVVNSLLANKNLLKSSSPAFIHLAVSGLEGVTANHGFQSVQFTDALKLLQKVISRVATELRTLYGDDVVIDLVAFTPESSIKSRGRHVRSLLATSDSTSVLKSSLNLAPGYTDMYSAIFNICLWFMIIFAITLLYIAWAIWFMDPGRDSIIYRMTSTRLKRD